jgi:hypothetical protein
MVRLNQNKVTEYQGKDKMIQGGGTPYGYIVEGQPIGKFYIMKVDIVQSKDEIDACLLTVTALDWEEFPDLVISYSRILMG